MEPPSRLPSPWAHDSTPPTSPGPPPSPAVWKPHDWTSVSRRDAVPSRSLPLIPTAHETHPALRTNTTISPLPTHPEFLRNLHSHPMIIQRGDDAFRTPSPASSIEFVMAAKQDVKPGSPVPFPVTSGYTSPVLCASPRPLPSVGSSQSSIHSLPSNESSPARTPDSALSTPMPGRNMQFPPPPPPPFPVPFSKPTLQLPSKPQSQSQPQSQYYSQSQPQLNVKVQSISQAESLSQPQSQSQVQTQGRGISNRIQTPGPRSRTLATTRGSTGPVPALPAPPLPEPDCRRHPLFYMKEGMVVLKIEGSLYRVHKYLLEHHSDFFRGFLTDDPDSLGHSDDRPIPLPENITQEAFDCLLSFLYTGIYDPISVPLSDWITLLRISSLLQFTKVRQYAIRELTARRTSIAAVDTIVLAKEHDVHSWLGPAYAELVRRPTPLEDDEAERIGVRVSVQIARAREMLRAEEFSQYQQRKHGARYVPAERPDEQLVARAVNEVFKLPAPNVH